MENTKTLYQSKKEGKNQDSIQSSTTPDPGHQWESDNFTITYHKREPRGQPPKQTKQQISSIYHSITTQPFWIKTRCDSITNDEHFMYSCNVFLIIFSLLALNIVLCLIPPIVCGCCCSCLGLIHH